MIHDVKISMVWPIIAGAAIGFIVGAGVGIGVTLYIQSRGTEIPVRPLVKGILITLGIALITIAGLLIIFPDVITDPPSEIWCEPPLKNYNSVCSCGPDMELINLPGEGGLMCKPISK